MENLTPAMATVIASFISGCVAIFVCIMNSRSQQKKLIDELQRQNIEKQTAEAVRDARLEARLKNVEEKLDIHNGYAEKLGSIETSIAVIQNDIKTLYRKGD